MASLAPFEPTATAPWGLPQARRLLERAGFGGPPEAVAELAALGPAEAVGKLCALRERAPAAPPDWLTVTPPPREELKAAGEAERRRLRKQAQGAERKAVFQLKTWWLQQMVSSTTPFEEKLALFWHGHFAVESQKVKNATTLFHYLELFRSRGSEKFGDLVLAISRDPAMLVYLDNHLNVRSHPNENYARELFELFTLGIGNYSEDDVKNSARAFTGWSLATAGWLKRGGESEFQFRPLQHDAGPKTILGESGNLNGQDVVSIILKQPSCSTFLARKLWRFFVDDAVDEADEAQVAALAQTLVANDFAIGPTLRTLFASSAFFDPKHQAAHIKSPVELVVGTLRQLGITPTDAQAGFLTLALNGLGQELLDPPNVAGWPGGREWVNTATLLNRYNLCGYLVNGGGAAAARRRQRRNNAGAPPLPAFAAGDGESLARAVCARLLVAPLGDEQQAALARYAGDELKSRGAEDAARSVVHLVMSTPNYQLT